MGEILFPKPLRLKVLAICVNHFQTWLDILSISVSLICVWCYTYSPATYTLIGSTVSSLLLDGVMGVKGLWKLLDGTGRPVDLDSLEGKVLAVDISVWLNMAVKGMRDYHGHASQTAHLVSLFNRICKLLYHGIKPVFVFDGKAPALKQKTLRERRDRKTENVRESKKANEKILQNFLKRQLLDEISDSAPKKQSKRSKGKTPSDEKSQKPASTNKQKPQDDDIYDLPPLSANLDQSDDSELEEELTMRAELQREFYDNITSNEFQNLLDINIESKDFNSLPSDVQYELLQDLHEVRKRQRTRIEAMPEESNSFSNYQIKGLLAKRKITKKMESVENKMSQENVEASSDFFGVNRESMEDHTVVARQLVSDSKSHFIWLRKSSTAKSKGHGEDQSDKNNNDDIATTSNSPEGKIILPQNLSVPIANNNRIALKNPPKRELNIQPHNLIHVKSPTKITGSESRPTRKTIEVSPNSDIFDGVQIHNEDIAATAKSTDSNYSVPINVNLHSNANSEEADDITKLHKNEKCELPRFETVTSKPENLTILPKVQPLNPVQIHFSSSTSDRLSQRSDQSESPNQKHAPSPFENSPFQESYPQEYLGGQEEVLPTSQSIATPEILNEDNSADSNDNFVDVPEEAHSKGADSPQSNSSDSAGEVSSNVESQENTNLKKKNLWEGLDIADMEKYTEEIDQQSKELRKLMQAKERAAREVSQSAQSECQDLLKLFGLPYIVSPQEAEAQCAALEEIGLTNGTITDDSDIWLFGGKYVIKDMFGSRKDPVAYHVSDIETQLGLNRDRFICIALCSGSDYTCGIHGVGPVTAMEILKEFDGTGINGLVKLKQWWDDIVATPKQSIPTETKIKSQIRRINLKKDFPSEAVYNAYMQPIVNTDNKKFEWGFPDLDELRVFATDIIGWTRQRVDEILLPVIKRQGQRKSAQSKITNFYQPSLHPFEKKRSKRVKRAALVLTGKQDLNKSSSTALRQKKSSTGTKKQRQKKVNLKKGNQLSELKLSESSSSDDK